VTELLARAPRRSLRQALLLAAATFLGVLVDVALVIEAGSGARPPQAEPEQAPAPWRLSPRLARSAGDAVGEEKRLLAAFHALPDEAAARGAFVAALGADFGAVEAGKRAVLGEAVLRETVLDGDARDTLDPHGVIDALWALEELETAPEALVVTVDALDGELAARLAERDDSGARIATCPRAALELDPPPPAALDSAQLRPHGFRIGLLAGALAAGAVLVGLLATRGESPARARQREDFFYAVTHELKTPLSTIALCAETLQRHGQDDPAAVPRFAATIRDETERLQGRIHQVLQLAAGRVPEAFGGPSFDAASALPAIVAEYVATARQAGVRLVLLADGAPWIVAGSVELFAQALGGLLENAIRHGGPGVVRIAARAEPGALHVSVQDEGPGIPPEHVPQLFTVRPSADPSARPGTGSGLGLAFVRQSLEALGGSIRLDSGAGPGATFRLVVPLARAHARPETDA